MWKKAVGVGFKILYFLEGLEKSTKTSVELAILGIEI
jgi:hypothetical protein